MKSFAPDHLRFPFCFVALLSGSMTVTVPAQESEATMRTAPYIMRTAPYPAFTSPEPRNYNLKWGRMTGRLHGSVQTEFNDNINLAARNAESDFLIGPNIGVGFLWPISQLNVLQFDLGLGYRWYVNNSRLNSLNIAPDSRLNYQFAIRDVHLTLHDAFQIQVDPLLRGEISGRSGSTFNFRRFNNDAGLSADWQAFKDVGFVASLGYTMDRALSDEFRELDRNDYTFGLGTYYLVSPRWTTGLNFSYTVTEYVERIQNNGVSYTLGPRVSFRPSKFLTIDASAGYTTSSYSQTGTIGDRSDFQGASAQLGVQHRMNSRTSQSFRLSKSLNPGLGSNYTDTLSMQYGLTLRATKAISLNPSLTYETLASSGVGGEQADRYMFYVGTGFQFTRRWNMGVAYSFGWKDSQLPGRDYTQNRVTLDFTRQF